MEAAGSTGMTCPYRVRIHPCNTPVAKLTANCYPGCMRLLFTLLLALTFPCPLQAAQAATFFPLLVQPKPPAAGDKILAKAFKQGLSEFMVKFNASVITILSDDTDGSRHQRFIVKLASGQTLLIVHNIDLAPRVKKLKVGHKVTVHGEYIWNNKGGLIHKTHLDPGNDDPHGWIQHKGKRYQ